MSRDNANAQAEQLGTENEQLRKKVASLESGIKEHTAERRKTDQLQRTLNTERERWAGADLGYRNPPRLSNIVLGNSLGGRTELLNYERS